MNEYIRCLLDGREGSKDRQTTVSRSVDEMKNCRKWNLKAEMSYSTRHACFTLRKVTLYIVTEAFLDFAGTDPSIKLQIFDK